MCEACGGASLLEEMKKYSPDIFSYCQESMKNKKNDLYFEVIKKESFEKCPNISIDKSIMEKTKLGYVLPLDSDWSDIGSWKSLWENSEKAPLKISSPPLIPAFGPISII